MLFSSLNILELREEVNHSHGVAKFTRGPFRMMWSSHSKWKGFQIDAQLSVIVFDESKYTFLSAAQYHVL